jgi:hypothetical protein
MRNARRDEVFMYQLTFFRNARLFPSNVAIAGTGGVVKEVFCPAHGSYKTFAVLRDRLDR